MTNIFSNEIYSLIHWINHSKVEDEPIEKPLMNTSIQKTLKCMLSLLRLTYQIWFTPIHAFKIRHNLLTIIPEKNNEKVQRYPGRGALTDLFKHGPTLRSQSGMTPWNPTICRKSNAGFICTIAHRNNGILQITYEIQKFKNAFSMHGTSPWFHKCVLHMFLTCASNIKVGT